MWNGSSLVLFLVPGICLGFFLFGVFSCVVFHWTSARYSAAFSAYWDSGIWFPCLSLNLQNFGENLFLSAFMPVHLYPISSISFSCSSLKFILSSLTFCLMSFSSSLTFGKSLSSFALAFCCSRSQACSDIYGSFVLLGFPLVLLLLLLLVCSPIPRS